MSLIHKLPHSFVPPHYCVWIWKKTTSRLLQSQSPTPIAWTHYLQLFASYAMSTNLRSCCRYGTTLILVETVQFACLCFDLKNELFILACKTSYINPNCLFEMCQN
jgi:hypothetical protein